MSLFKYAQTKQPTPGTGSYAFERPSGLPRFMLQGPGTRFRRQIYATQPPQVVHNLAVSVAGLGGIIAGTAYLQPLIED